METETFKGLLEAANAQNVYIHTLVEKNEADFLEIKIPVFRKRVLDILNTMKESIKRGLNSKELSPSGLSGCNTSIIKQHLEENKGFSLFSPLQKKVMLYASSVIEENARMGKIAACPTAGSSGIVPAVIMALGEELQAKEDTLIDALITAGAVGEIISRKTALAGAVAGCQAECGAASAMAAAAAVFIISSETSGSDPVDINNKTVNASALALKNILGLTCDPVGGLVEVPCVKRNIFMAIHALTAAELSLSGVISAIPADDVVDAMRETGSLMASSLKESSEAGLAKTKTGIKIEQKLLHQEF